MPALQTEVGPLRLRNPLLLASGIWGESGRSLARAWECGAGGVITKSIGEEPRDGFPNPTVERLGEWGFLNAMGLPNPGIEAYQAEVAEALGSGALVIGSIFAGTPGGFARLTRAMERLGVAALELNLSCPHAEGFGTEVGGTPAGVRRIVRAVRAATELPVIAKLTPNTDDPAALARAAEEAGADAVSAVNTLRALRIDLATRRPVLAHGLGGLSGPALRPVALAAAWQIARAVRIPVIGVGGISTADDALEFALAGAAAVEVGTAVADRGPALFGEIAAGLDRRLGELGFCSWRDAIGAALFPTPPPVPVRQRRPTAPVRARQRPNGKGRRRP